MRIRSVLAARVRIRVERIAAGAASAVLPFAPELRFCTLLDKRAPTSTGRSPWTELYVASSFGAEISAFPDIAIGTPSRHPLIWTHHGKKPFRSEAEPHPLALQKPRQFSGATPRECGFQALRLAAHAGDGRPHAVIHKSVALTSTLEETVYIQ